MEKVKHYGAADLYDPTPPAGGIPAALDINGVALGRNVRVWMRNRIGSKTSNTGTLDKPSTRTLTKNSTTLNPSASSTDVTKSLKPTFLSLPGEIRNICYHFTVFPSHRFLLVLSCSHPRDIFRSLLRNPLFRVSRQIRAEVFYFLVTTKHLCIHNLRTATTFFRYLGPVGRANLNNVTIALLHLDDVDLECGRELPRLMREVRGPGIRRVRILMHSQVPLTKAWGALLKEMREALGEGCEEMEIQWNSTEGGILGVSDPMPEEALLAMEEVFGKESRVGGSMWSLVARSV